MSGGTPAARPTLDLDGPRVVRGASRGFTILALGGVVQPWVGTVSPFLGYWWLVIVAVAAFVLSARVTGATSAPVVNGAAAALGGYLLILPLVHMATGTLSLEQATYTSGLALLTGAGTGWLSRLRTERHHMPPKGR